MDRKEELVNWLPVEQLWPLLIAVSCQHTGQERLKVIGLLMDIVCLMSEGADEKWKAKLKLSALKPLWQLYTTVIKEFGEGLGSSFLLLWWRDFMRNARILSSLWLGTGSRLFNKEPAGNLN